MSKLETSAGDLSAAETDLGKALFLLQRALARFDDPGRAADVQADLRRVGTCIELARVAHEKDMTARGQGAVGAGQASVDSETAAVIAAAIAALLDGPHRLVSVQPVAAPVPHLNVWAFEGRTQIFQSHKIR